MNLIGGVGVPDDELTVLRSGDKVSTIGGPVHSVNLRQMALESSTGFHTNSRQRVGITLSDSAD